MTISLPIPVLKIVRRQTKVIAPNRIVPEPKRFVLPVVWEEALAQPIPVTVEVRPQPCKSMAPLASTAEFAGKTSTISDMTS